MTSATNFTIKFNFKIISLTLQRFKLFEYVCHYIHFNQELILLIHLFIIICVFFLFDDVLSLSHECIYLILHRNSTLRLTKH